MVWNVYNNIITGMTPTTLSPSGNATRAECAMILMRFIQTFVGAGANENGETDVTDNDSTDENEEDEG